MCGYMEQESKFICRTHSKKRDSSRQCIGNVRATIFYLIRRHASTVQFDNFGRYRHRILQLAPGLKDGCFICF